MYMLLKAGANGDFVIVINSQKIYHKALSESPTTIRILNALIDDKFPSILKQINFHHTKVFKSKNAHAT